MAARWRAALAAAQPRVRLGLAGAAAALLAALVWTFASPAPAPSPALASIARTPPAVKVSPAAKVGTVAPVGRAPALASGDSVMLGAADGLIRALGPPRRWQDEVNTRVRAAVEGWPGAVLADWNAVSARGGGGGLFWDGVHLTQRGVALYAQTIKRALRA